MQPVQLVLVVLTLVVACFAPPVHGHAGGEDSREVRVLMGTTAEVQVGGLADPAPALDAAFAALTHVDDTLSLWKASELTRLNDAGHGRVSTDLMAVLRHALNVAAASGGAFDPTMEPLLRAEGRLGGPRRRLLASERQTLLARVGFFRVRIDLETAEVTLAPGTRLDFGGIAKGHAADVALEALRKAGATRGLVNLGESSIGVFGEELAIDARDPERRGGRPWASFWLADGAVATSGGDQQPGHVLDPKTGLPSRAVLAATVVARTGVEADALSTAVYVLGSEPGLRLLEQRGAAGFVLERRGGQRTLRATRGFSAAHRVLTRSGVRVIE